MGGTEEASGVTKEEEEEPEVRCGLGKCRPTFLQTCNNSKMLLFIMSLVVFTQGMESDLLPIKCEKRQKAHRPT